MSGSSRQGARRVGGSLSALAVACALVALLSPPRALAEAYTWRNVQIVGGGFVPGIVFNATEPNLVYARTDIGGAYRWNPSTSSWIPLLDWAGGGDWSLTGVDSLATDPVDPNRVYVLAGTYTNSWDPRNGAVLRSTDRGNTWQKTDLTFKSGGNMPGRSMGERLAIDPNRNSILLLGARSGNGLWRSADHGATWSEVTSFPNPGAYVQKAGDVYQGDVVGVVWVVFDPRTGSSGSATQTIYVGVADNGTSIYRSTDGGASWDALPGQTTGYLPHHGVLGSNGLLYITYSDGVGPYDGQKGDVWKYDTASGAWTSISPVPSSSSDDYYGYGGLAVDAQHPDTIMVAALNSWWPDTILFRSLDAGATWTRIWDWAGYPSRSFRYAQDISAAPWLTFNGNPSPPETAPKLGWMVGDLEIDPHDSNRMLYGTGATIYGADDLTAWDSGGTIHISVKAKGIEETAVLDLVSPPSGAPLLSALGDVCGFRHDDLSTVPAKMFGSPTFSSSTGIDFAELSPGFVVRVGNADTSSGVKRAAFSYDGGTSWFQANSEPSGGGGGNVAAAADASRVVWSPEGGTVSYSTDNGNSWTACSGVPTGARVAADRVDPKKFYGAASGNLYVSANGGQTFTAGATGLPSSARIKAVPGREGDVWLAGGDGGLWHSTDSGATFTKLSSVEKADTIGFGKAASGQSYVALYTSGQVDDVRGIYRSTDAGASWTRLNDDQHQYGSTNAVIAGDPRVFGRVYVGTNGRGIVYGEPSGATASDFSLSANPASGTLPQGSSGSSAITISRTQFTDSVSLTVSGLLAGVTASFAPASTTGTTSTLTVAVSPSAEPGTYPLTVTGTGGGLTRAVQLHLTVSGTSTGFSLSANPAGGTLPQGSSGSSAITISRTDFTDSVRLTVSGLPAGVTAALDPATTTGTASTLTVAASASAAPGTSTLTVTGTGDGLTRTVQLYLTVSASASADFALSASPSSVAVTQGASAAATLSIARTGGFASSVALAASGLPAGVTAAFSPASATGDGSTVTFTASASAASGTSAVTITGTGGGLTRSVSVPLSVNTGGGGATGGVTVTPASTSGGWYTEDAVHLSSTGTLTALTVTIAMQRTAGLTAGGQYNTVGAQIQQSNASSAAAIDYQFTLAPGQTLAPGSGHSFVAQASGTGTAHPTAGDAYTVTYTTGGVSYTQSGHF